MSVTPIRECNALALNNGDLGIAMRDAVMRIEGGDYGAVRNVVIAIETQDGQMEHLTFGLPIDRCRTVGLLTALVHRMLSP